jgi:hypothetical protein
MKTISILICISLFLILLIYLGIGFLIIYLQDMKYELQNKKKLMSVSKKIRLIFTWPFSMAVYVLNSFNH